MAPKFDPANGNRYFDLGFTFTANDKLADALKNMVRADELEGSTENLVQLYNLLSVICFDIDRYDNALVEPEKQSSLPASI